MADSSQFGRAQFGRLPFGRFIGAAAPTPPPPPTAVVLETPSQAAFSNRPALEVALQSSVAFNAGGASPAVGAWYPYVDSFPQILVQ